MEFDGFGILLMEKALYLILLIISHKLPYFLPFSVFRFNILLVNQGGESQEVAAGIGCTSKTPKSPWMHFAVLFEAISGKTIPKAMNMVLTQYELFRVR